MEEFSSNSENEYNIYFFISTSDQDTIYEDYLNEKESFPKITLSKKYDISVSNGGLSDTVVDTRKIGKKETPIIILFDNEKGVLKTNKLDEVSAYFEKNV